MYMFTGIILHATGPCLNVHFIQFIYQVKDTPAFYVNLRSPTPLFVARVRQKLIIVHTHKHMHKKIMAVRVLVDILNTNIS